MKSPAVRYVTTSDGYSIAYAVSGEGPPLVLLPKPFSDIEHVWLHYPEWVNGLAASYSLVQFDHRGEGLSTRGLPLGMTIADMCRDLETVVQQLGLPQFTIYAFGARCHIAVRYALAHPERVRALILDTGSVSNTAWREGLWRVLPRENWEFFLSSLIQRGASIDDHLERLAVYKRYMTLDDYEISMDAVFPSSVEDALPRLQTPTLILYPRDFRTLPREESMRFAAMIPNAQFVLIGGDHVHGEAPDAVLAISDFLTGLKAKPAPGPHEPVKLSHREVEVLRLIAAGNSNREIADELVLSVRTVERHITNLYGKIGARGKADATAYALRHALV